MLINQNMLEDVKGLHEALYYMYQQHKCGCGNPACNRCEDDADNGELLSNIQEKYHNAEGWKRL